jgi:hypothetical protein
MAYLALCALSGLVWAMIVYVLGRAAIGSDIWGGIVASPLIGVAVGLLFRRIRLFTRGWRVFLSLLSLYVGAVLFGLAMSVPDVARAHPDQRPVALVVENIIGMLWGTTLTGYVLFLWPLAYLNHRLLADAAEE